MRYDSDRYSISEYINNMLAPHFGKAFILTRFLSYKGVAVHQALTPLIQPSARKILWTNQVTFGSVRNKFIFDGSSLPVRFYDEAAKRLFYNK